MRHGFKIFDSDTHLLMEFAIAGALEPAAAVGVILSAIAIGVALIARRLGLTVLSESMLTLGRDSRCSSRSGSP